jgi:hypothetical protein
MYYDSLGVEVGQTLTSFLQQKQSRRSEKKKTTREKLVVR